MSLLVALGCFTGLRISDILALRWEQILSTEEFTIIEKKTGKKRVLRLLMKIASRIHRMIGYNGAAFMMFEFCVLATHFADSILQHSA